jgi:hypothetical protein
MLQFLTKLIMRLHLINNTKCEIFYAYSYKKLKQLKQNQKMIQQAPEMQNVNESSSCLNMRSK